MSLQPRFRPGPYSGNHWGNSRWIAVANTNEAKNPEWLEAAQAGHTNSRRGQVQRRWREALDEQQRAGQWRRSGMERAPLHPQNQAKEEMKDNQSNKDSLEMMARARICAIIKKTGRFTWWPCFVGLAISVIAALITSMQLLSLGNLIAGIGLGGSMALELILSQFQADGVFEPDQSEPK